MTIHSVGHTRIYEMEALLKLFLPAQRFQFATTPQIPADDGISAVVTPITSATNRLCCQTRLHGQVLQAESDLPVTVVGNDLDRAISTLLYPQLCALTGIQPAWGMLTGIRPVNLLRRFVARDGGLPQALESFDKVWHVSPQKRRLAARILSVQEPLFAATPARAVSVYVSIPFCPSRCHYCSFVSHSVQQMQKLLPEYLQALGEELQIVGELLTQTGLTVDTVYIGGGTPTVLAPDALRFVLDALEESILAPHAPALREYTVEAGRPDTITKEKLQVLQQHHVTRISVNPQSFQDAVLAAAGRPHTAADAVAAYRLAKDLGFENVNMDLIAGLPCDTPTGFQQSVEQAIALAPESITVHCLALKKAADFYATLPMPNAQAVCDMVDFAEETIQAAGYRPYYLYRQKNMAGNLENVGYAKPGMESPYNVLMMDDSQTILGVGSGASTKIIGYGRGIARITECKYPYEYLQRFPQLMAEKRNLREVLCNCV